MRKEYKLGEGIKVTLTTANYMSGHELKKLFHKLADSKVFKETLVGFYWGSDTRKISKLIMEGDTITCPEFNNIEFKADVFDRLVESKYVTITKNSFVGLSDSVGIFAKTEDELKDKIASYVGLK